MNFSPTSQSAEICLTVGGMQTEQDGEQRWGDMHAFPTHITVRTMYI